MEENPRPAFTRGSTWHHVAITLTVLLMLTNVGPVSVGRDDVAFGWAGT